MILDLIVIITNLKVALEKAMAFLQYVIRLEVSTALASRNQIVIAMVQSSLDDGGASCRRPLNMDFHVSTGFSRRGPSLLKMANKTAALRTFESSVFDE
jgi:hypothetical protein